MITPTEILAKANRLYPQAITAWLEGQSNFFPRRLPANLHIAKHIPQSDVIRQVNVLRVGSKAQLGYGYTVLFEQVASRSHGDNNFPNAIQIDSLQDLVQLVRKQTEFRVLETAVGKLRSRLPQLEDWLRTNWKRLLPLAGELDALITVVEYLRDHPRPDCYVRELPLAVSTKVIEKNKALLRDWLDRTLAPTAIDFGCDRRDFEQRYGFRYARKHILLRVLDPRLLAELGLPSRELSLPAAEIAKLPLRDLRVFVVENKINLLTLPPQERGLALGGLGNNLSEFAKIPQLNQFPLHYWGDVDTAGLLILARFRRQFPQTHSLLMDAHTLTAHNSLCTKHRGELSLAVPTELQPAEVAAFLRCRDDGIRLEQEHIPQDYVLQAVTAAASQNDVALV